MPNRHERRRAEAEHRKGFEQYRDLCRRAYKTLPDGEIGEAYMRGEKAAALGIEYMMIHPTGEAPPAWRDDDIILSVGYYQQKFKARVPASHLQKTIDQWPEFVRQARERGVLDFPDDERAGARQFVFDQILNNRAQIDPTHAALTASAIAWLVKGSPAGLAFGSIQRAAHYEITDQAELSADGRRARNFRLTLLKDLSDPSELAAINTLPIPQW
jgi:hypothetical protein